MSVNMGLWPDGKCDEGHDLTLPGAWLYQSSGSRSCRECAVARLPASHRLARKAGAFNGGIGKWRS